MNLLGALALVLTDDMRAAVEERATRGANAPAAIVSIGWAPGETIDTLSQTLGLSHSATVRLIDRLVADGLVERRRGADGRSAALYLTAAGRRCRKSSLAARRSVLAAALASLSDDEQRQLSQITEKILNAVTRNRTHADHICRLCDESVCPLQTCPVEAAAQ